MGNEIDFLTQGLGERFLVESKSPTVQALERVVSEIAPTEIPVLVLGESGTGKEVVALQIHRLSGRRKEPFIKLVCASLAPDTMEDFLLGKGDGNGKTQGLSGAGTVFLDEISELDLASQPKLVHVLPDGDAVPHEPRLHARVISSSRRNLEDEIRSGHFREDLYYRLNDICLRLPPLRHRKEDIPGLVDFFLAKYATQFSREKPSLGAQTMDRLVNYSWPGNIRQLENAVRKIVALGDERLAVADLGSLAAEPMRANYSGVKVSLKQASRAASHQAERELILRALERTRWNRKRAAMELQISYKALLYKLKQIGLEDAADSMTPSGEQP